MRKRRRFRPEFRSKLGLEALAGAQPAEACRDHGLSPATRPGQLSDPRAVKVSDGAAPYAGGWCHSLILGLGLLFAYTANGREMGTDDTEATTMLPLSLLRGDGISLERFSPLLRDERTTSAVRCAVARPPSLVLSGCSGLTYCAADGTANCVFGFRQPGWDLHPGRAMKACRRMAKWSVSVLMALAAVTLHRFLLRLGLYREALPAVVAAFLGSDLWTHASQALWQHGPAALSLIAALALLHPGPVSRWRFVLAGMATTLLFQRACWIRSSRRRSRVGCPVAASTPVLVPARRRCRSRVAARLQLLVLRVDRRRPVQLLAELHPRLHGVDGTWSGSLIEGAAGTLFSPNRGLFIFSPWIAVGLVVGLYRPWRAGSHPRAWLPGCWLGWCPISFSSRNTPSGGADTASARYWTDVIPLFAIVLAFGLEWILHTFAPLVVLSYLTIAFSIGVHGIGAFCYPSTWNHVPANVDLHHERSWSWRDTEISRCLVEKMLGRL